MGRPFAAMAAAERIRLHDVAGLVERVRGGAGVEVSAAFAIADVEEAAAVRPAWHADDLHDVAIEPDILIELHLLPVLQSDVRVVGIDAAEVVVAVPHGLHEQTGDGFAIGVEDFELRIGGRAGLSGERLDDPRLAFFGIEGEVIGVTKE
jgi:hypothetical protein